MNCNLMAKNLLKMFYFHTYPIGFGPHTAISLSYCMKICCLQCPIGVQQLQHAICIRENLHFQFSNTEQGESKRLVKTNMQKEHYFQSTFCIRVQIFKSTHTRVRIHTDMNQNKINQKRIMSTVAYNYVGPTDSLQVSIKAQCCLPHGIKLRKTA